MMATPSGWFFWAVLSACFAALTAIFAKIGIQGVDSDFATLIRTVIIVLVLAAFVGYAGKWSDPRALSPRTLLFLSLSALATGASWCDPLCRGRANPRDLGPRTASRCPHSASPAAPWR